MTIMNIDASQVSTILGILSAIGIAAGGWATSMYRLSRVEIEAERARIAHESEVKELKARIDAMDSKHSLDMGGLYNKLNEMGNRLTRIETMLERMESRK